MSVGPTVPSTRRLDASTASWLKRLAAGAAFTGEAVHVCVLEVEVRSRSSYRSNSAPSLRAKLDLDLLNPVSSAPCRCAGQRRP